MQHVRKGDGLHRIVTEDWSLIRDRTDSTTSHSAGFVRRPKGTCRVTSPSCYLPPPFESSAMIAVQACCRSNAATIEKSSRPRLDIDLNSSPS